MFELLTKIQRAIEHGDVPAGNIVYIVPGPSEDGSGHIDLPGQVLVRMFAYGDTGLSHQRVVLGRHGHMAEGADPVTVLEGIAVSVRDGQAKHGPSGSDCLEHPALGTGFLYGKYILVGAYKCVGGPFGVTAHGEQEVLFVGNYGGGFLGHIGFLFDIGRRCQLHRHHGTFGLNSVVLQGESDLPGLFYLPVRATLTGDFAVADSFCRNGQFPFTDGRHLEDVRQLAGNHFHDVGIGETQPVLADNGSVRSRDNGEETLFAVVPFWVVVAYLDGDSFQGAVVRHDQLARVARTQG